MWNTFKYTVIAILRERSIVIWVILFPLILSTLFNAMFSGMDEATELDPIPAAIVDDSRDGTGEMFMRTLDALSGDDALIDPIEAASTGDAFELLKSGDAVGIITVDENGWPSLEMSQGIGDVGMSMEQFKRTILADVVNDFCRSRTTAEDIIATNPSAFANQRVVESLSTWDEYTEQITITHSKTAESVRYFYALLGFAALMAATVGLNAVGPTLPNISPLGARRTVGGTSRSKTLAASIAAAWIVSFAALLVAFAYIRFVLGIEFGGREPFCILGLAVAALMATSLGALVGAIPFIPFPAKGGMLTGITCVLSLFAGLYGTPSMSLADQIAHDAPWTTAVNPAKQVTNLFYSLYVYTDLNPFYQMLGMLVAVTAVLTFAAALLMRRQQHASL